MLYFALIHFKRAISMRLKHFFHDARTRSLAPLFSNRRYCKFSIRERKFVTLIYRLDERNGVYGKVQMYKRWKKTRESKNSGMRLSITQGLEESFYYCKAAADELPRLYSLEGCSVPLSSPYLPAARRFISASPLSRRFISRITFSRPVQRPKCAKARAPLAPRGGYY